jgi:alanine dehydrogenase
MHIFSNDDIKNTLVMKDCIAALDEAYRQYAAGEAVMVPRNDLETMCEGDYSKGLSEPVGNDPRQHTSPQFRQAMKGLPGPYFFLFKTMSAAVRKGGPIEFGCAALRLNADILSDTDTIDGKLRRQRIPAAPGNRYCGMVMLWKTENCEPICIMPDSWIEGMRVGATNALAAKYLARPDSSVYALIGAGHQARAQLEAMLEVLPIKSVRVFSPTKESREFFALEQGRLHDIEVQAVTSIADAVRDADIIGSATNAMAPILTADLPIKKGAFINSINLLEVDRGLVDTLDLLVLHANRVTWPTDPSECIFTPDTARQFMAFWLTNEAKVKDRVPHSLTKAWMNTPEVAGSSPWLGDVISGAVRRTNDQQTTGFINNIGFGLQFAAVGAIAYQAAIRKGLGQAMPTHMFTQDTQG